MSRQEAGQTLDGSQGVFFFFFLSRFHSSFTVS